MPDTIIKKWGWKRYNPDDYRNIELIVGKLSCVNKRLLFFYMGLRSLLGLMQGAINSGYI